MPIESKWRPSLWRRKPRDGETDYPRFPGYLFIAVEPPHWPDLEAWPFLAFARGFVAMAGGPVPLAPGEIERLRSEDGMPVPHLTSVPLHKALAADQRVRIMTGAFRDFEAAVEAIDEDGAHLTVMIFGRPTPIVLPLTLLETA